MAMATMLFNRLFVCINPIRNQHQSMPAKASELSSAKSQLKSCGFSSLKISYEGATDNARAVGTSTALVRPLASRVCPLTGKRANNANKISFSNHKTKKLQGVNLQYKRIWWEAGKRYVKLRLSTKALKTIEKKGLDAMAKKAGINLKKR